jgi:hypothetical protein
MEASASQNVTFFKAVADKVQKPGLGLLLKLHITGLAINLPVLATIMLFFFFICPSRNGSTVTKQVR